MLFEMNLPRGAETRRVYWTVAGGSTPGSELKRTARRRCAGMDSSTTPAGVKSFIHCNSRVLPGATVRQSLRDFFRSTKYEQALRLLSKIKNRSAAEITAGVGEAIRQRGRTANPES